MSGLEPEVRKITDKLDAVGNTTAAMGKGFAIGSAALTALALFVSYAEAVKLEKIDLLDSRVIIGILLGRHASVPVLRHDHAVCIQGGLSDDRRSKKTV